LQIDISEGDYSITKSISFYTDSSIKDQTLDDNWNDEKRKGGTHQGKGESLIKFGIKWGCIIKLCASVSESTFELEKDQ
jgi:hypothetical protein